MSQGDAPDVSVCLQLHSEGVRQKTRFGGKRGIKTLTMFVVWIRCALFINKPQRGEKEERKNVNDKSE